MSSTTIQHQPLAGPGKVSPQGSVKEFPQAFSDPPGFKVNLPPPDRAVQPHSVGIIPAVTTNAASILSPGPPSPTTADIPEPGNSPQAIPVSSPTDATDGAMAVNDYSDAVSHVQVLVSDEEDQSSPRRATTVPQRRRSSQQRTTSNDTENKKTIGLKRTVTTLLVPEKRLSATPSVFQSIRAIVLASWLNPLLVFIPVAWAMDFAKQNDILILIFSFLAIIPLARLRSLVAEELALYVGQIMGRFLSVTLGNAIELIVAVVALTKCKLFVLQSALVGSILSKILLVLGMCFFAGGTRFSEQGFLYSAVKVNSSLLILSVIAVLMPAAFVMVVHGSQNNDLLVAVEGSNILKMSRAVAVVLLFIYGSYLIFQLWSHAYLYGEADISVEYSRGVAQQFTDLEAPKECKYDEGNFVRPQLTVVTCIILLMIVTILVAFSAEWLVDSLDGVTSEGKISQQWIGLVLPIAANVVENIITVTFSIHDKLTRSLEVAVGSSIQIALFIIPFLTILAWIMSKPLTLLFDPFLSLVLFFAVITVNYSIQDGKSNWLMGMILMCLYVIIAISFWNYPEVNLASNLGLQCHA